MPFFRYFAVALLIAAVVLLTGALNSHPTTPTPLSANPEVHAAAAKLLDDALGRLDPARVGWLETKVWQKGRLDRFTYESEGRYLVGPGRRARLELTTHHGRADATMLAVSNGELVWQGRRTSDGRWADVTRSPVSSISPAPATTDAPAPPGEESLRGPSLGGVLGLLRSMRSRIDWSRKETVRRDGRECTKLTGSCPADSSSNLPWPDGMPRQCRLYLDVQTLWPHRVEWWGPDSPRSGDVLLQQIEFRAPVLNRPLSAEQASREFAFPTDGK